MCTESVWEVLPVKRGRQYMLVYSFLGWVLEGCYQWKVTGRFAKANFFRGPVKPMYGVAGVVLLYCYRRHRRQFVYLCWLTPLTVELVSGLWLERWFRLRYWDYSQEPGHLGPYICPRFALYWAVLSQLLVRLVHPVTERCCRYSRLQPVWPVLYGLFLCDGVSTICRRRSHCAVDGNGPMSIGAKV